jgi:hypothetical protein
MYTDLMTRVRQIAGPVAAGWLLVQTATLVLIPAIFYAGAAVAPIECTAWTASTDVDQPECADVCCVWHQQWLPSQSELRE